jgi:hypothetical protein
VSAYKIILRRRGLILCVFTSSCLQVQPLLPRRGSLPLRVLPGACAVRVRCGCGCDSRYICFVTSNSPVLDLIFVFFRWILYISRSWLALLFFLLFFNDQNYVRGVLMAPFAVAVLFSSSSHASNAHQHHHVHRHHDDDNGKPKEPKQPPPQWCYAVLAISYDIHFRCFSSPFLSLIILIFENEGDISLRVSCY